MPWLQSMWTSTAAWHPAIDKLAMLQGREFDHHFIVLGLSGCASECCRTSPQPQQEQDPCSICQPRHR